MATLSRRDRDEPSYEISYGSTTVVFFTLVLMVGCCVATLVYVRRRRRRAVQASALPVHRRQGHARTLTIATTPSSSRGDAIFVYDEKMNLIANSNGPSDRPVPEIRVTFPEEQDNTGHTRAGHVVVLRISDTGSVGMEPLNREPLPPYQRHEPERLQSIDLERIGGLREKGQSSSQRFS